MRPVDTITVSPVNVEKSLREDLPIAYTTCRAGKIVPLYVAPLLREDRVTRSSIRVNVKSEETVHPLMNPVRLAVYAHFVPFFAFDRFAVGMDAFNRSYQGEPEVHNGTPIQFFNTIAYDKAAEFWKTLGIHEAQGATINASYLEAYNTLVNFRRKARSSKIALRTWNDTTLAQAFWHNPNMWHIVPDFEQAMMDGEVSLNLSGQAPVSGIGMVGTPGSIRGAGLAARGVTSGQDWTSVASGSAGQTHMPLRDSAGASDVGLAIKMAAGTLATARPAIFAELTGIVGKISLSNIELAKQTAAWAKIREQYSGLSEDHIMDLLLDGIRVPDEALRQPILLAKGQTAFGFNERHATDGASLAKSVTNGVAEVTLNFRTPPMNTGGVIIVTAEIVPEPLFERLQDKFLRITNPSGLPSFVKDFLDPDKVEVVENRFVDVLHGTPAGIFGYAPLNHHWKRALRRIGGKFFRPNPDTFVEDRLRFWSVEKLNPALTTDFYLVPANLPHTVFDDELVDPFEVLTLGSCEIVGNTVFGKVITEDDGNYAAVDAQVDKSRVVSV